MPASKAAAESGSRAYREGTRAKIDMMAANPNREGKSSNWRAWTVGILVAFVAIVALQNSQDVRVDVLFASFTAPLIVTLLAAVAVGALIGYIAPLVLRHRRQGKHDAKLEG